MTRRQQRMLIVFSIGASIIITLLGILMLEQICEYLLNSDNVSQFNKGWIWSSETTMQNYQKARYEFWTTEGWLYSVLLNVSSLCRWCIGIISIVFSFGPTIFWISFFRKPEKTKTNR